MGQASFLGSLPCKRHLALDWSTVWGFPCSSVGKEFACSTGDRGSIPGLGRSSGEESHQWQPTPVSLPRKSHGQRNLVGCSPWGCKESGMTERLTLTCYVGHIWGDCSLPLKGCFCKPSHDLQSLPYYLRNHFATRWPWQPDQTAQLAGLAGGPQKRTPVSERRWEK